MAEALERRKRIGILISQPEDIYQSRLMHVLLEDSFSHGYDALVFTVNVKSEGTDKFRHGEANIYELVNYRELDGVVVVPDTIQIPGAIDRIEERIRTEFDGPAVSIDMELGSIHTVFTDDIEPLNLLTSHLIERHGCHKIAMVTGMKGHPHAENRVQGYREALERHYIPVNEGDIFYGDFWYSTGEMIINDLFEDGRLKYDGIVCASGQVAVGVCESLRARGISVPEDIKLVSYDVTDDITYSPTFTSATRPIENAAHEAIAYLYEQISGNKASVRLKNPILISCCESCGCNISSAPQVSVRYADMNFQSDFMATGNFMMEELIAATSMSQFIQLVSFFSYQLGDFKKLSFCLCSDWNAFNEEDEGRADGYSDKIRLEMTKCRGEMSEYPGYEFDRDDLLPDLREDDELPRVIYFSPVHFNERCFGYFALSYGNKSVPYDMCYKSWIRNVDNGLESLRLRNRLQLFNSMMARNARTDALTGIGNRFAFEEFCSALEPGNMVYVVVGDLNGLKYVNDNFGHVEGDFAIKAVGMAFAEAARHPSPNGVAKCFRYGGDEFILLAIGDYTEEEHSYFEKSILSTLECCRNSFDKPYPIMASLGCACGIIHSRSDIQSIVDAADKKMFAKKQRSKLKRK